MNCHSIIQRENVQHSIQVNLSIRWFSQQKIFSPLIERIHIALKIFLFMLIGLVVAKCI